MQRAIEALAAKHGAQRVWGQPCDVTDFAQVQALWDAARSHYGQVDVWINNAGLGHAQCDLCRMSQEEMEAIVQTNLVGTMYGAKVFWRFLAAPFRKRDLFEGMEMDGR